MVEKIPKNVLAVARAIYKARSEYYGGFVFDFDEIGEYRLNHYVKMALAAIEATEQEGSKT